MRIRTSKIAAVILGDDSVSLNPLEKALYLALRQLGPVGRILKEQWLFGQRAALEFYKLGIRDFLVLEAGVLVSGSLHQLLSDVRILYTDTDQWLVEEARKKLGESSNVSYVQGNIANWFDEVLPVAKDFFGERPRLGILMIGVAYFLPDEFLRRIFKSLYSWVAPGSCLAVTNFDVEVIRTLRSSYLRYAVFKAVYGMARINNYSRSDASLRASMLPWKVMHRYPIAPEVTDSGGGRVSVLGYTAIKEYNDYGAGRA